MNPKPIYHIKPTRNPIFPVKIIREGSKKCRYAKNQTQALAYLKEKFGDTIRIYDWCIMADIFSIKR